MSENVGGDYRYKKFNLLLLPTDLLLCVRDHLSKVDNVMLGATCNKANKIFSTGGNHLTVAERQDMRARLMRDHDKLYHCFRCDRMHSFAEDTGPLNCEEYEHPDGSKHHRRDEWTPLNGLYHSFYSNDYYVNDSFDSETALQNRNSDRSRAAGGITTYNLHFHHAQLVMMRHRLSAPHGIPLENLKAEIKKICDKGIKVTEEWSARIIDDELYLSVTHVITHESESLSKDLPQLLREQPHRICKHITTLDNHYEYIIKGRDPPRLNFKTHDGKRVCHHCLTEFYPEISHTPSFGWQIKIQAFHQLGRCQDPGEDRWRSFVIPYRINYNNYAEFLKNEYRVKEMWDADEKKDKERGSIYGIANFGASMLERQYYQKRRQDLQAEHGEEPQQHVEQHVVQHKKSKSNFSGTGRRVDDSSTIDSRRTTTWNLTSQTYPQATRGRTATIFDWQQRNSGTNNFQGEGRRLG